MDRFTVKRIDELSSIMHGAVKLAGDELGVESFGMQVLDLPAGFAGYPEHDHAEDGQEEVDVVLEGSADFVVGGTRVDADTGSMLRVGAGTTRRLTPGPQGVRILAVGRAPGGVYERPDDFRVAGQA